MDKVRQLHGKQSENEKITINLGFVDLGGIDLLVQEGFYSNRSDLIRTAIRNQLVSHQAIVTKSLERHSMELGLRDYSVADLQAVRDAGEILHIRVVGLVRFDRDVTPDLELASIGSITVLGALQASTDLKQALAARIK